MQNLPSVDKAATGGAQAIRRAVEVVRTVAQIQRSGANLTRVARASGLSISTSHRILRSLTEERLLRYDDSERCYHIGPLAFELGLAAEGEVQANWRETVERIARESRLTTYLVARSGNEVACLFCAQGSMALRAMPMEVGQRLPLGIGAGSLAILATLDDEEIRDIISAQGARRDVYPGNTAKSEQILERIELTRQRGYSVSCGTVALGLIGVGMAIAPRQDLTQLAISVSAVANSVDPAEAQELACVIAAAIQDNMARRKV